MYATEFGIHLEHLPITLGEAAYRTGKSERVLQRAAKLGLLRAWWARGRWVTTQVDAERYLEDYGRKRTA